ncbi:MAG: OmpH family outer membrane protein [Betaproteobacteria bacterium]|nr:OmpH family outer membrane protein [Betaproteobacteria bacterium]NBY72576.1 OmpH family outer membrane protein [Betaproteobacteria bacterium]NDD11353.1 OmpH family outer membrane protein [Betaproteobacteria bacterium]
MFKFSFLIAALSLLGAQQLWAQEFRLGYVNLDRIIREAAPSKSAQAKLEQEFARREKDLQEIGSALKSAADKLEREAMTLSESQRAARQKQVMDQDRDFQRKRREFQEDLNARKNEELQQVFERANRVVRQLAEAEKYDLIIQEAVYVSPKHDITDKVIRSLNSAK